MFAFINLHGVIGEVTNAFANGINSALIILCRLIKANNERYISTPGIIGITDGIVNT